MNIGKLDRRITLQQPQLAPANAFGGPGQQLRFSNVAQVWAEQTPGPGTEVVQANQLTAVQQTTWVIRYLPGVSPAWQLVYEGMVYAITGVQEVGRRKGLTLTTQYRGSALPELAATGGFPYTLPFTLSAWPTT